MFIFVVTKGSQQTRQSINYNIILTTNYFIMKKAFLYLLGIVLMATSCLDIADVYQRLDTLEQKVAGLEGLNTTVSGLSNSIEALRGNRLMLRGVGLNEKELEILGISHAGE